MKQIIAYLSILGSVFSTAIANAETDYSPFSFSSVSKQYVASPFEWKQKNWWMLAGATSIIAAASNQDDRIKQEVLEENARKKDSKIAIVGNA